MLPSVLPLNSTSKYLTLGWNGAEGAYTFLVPSTSQEPCQALLFYITLFELSTNLWNRYYSIELAMWNCYQSQACGKHLVNAVISIMTMRNWCFREIKSPTQDNTAIKWSSQDLNLGHSDSITAHPLPLSLSNPTSSGCHTDLLFLQVLEHWQSGYLTILILIIRFMYNHGNCIL